MVVADRLHTGTGQDPDYDSGVGHLWCIDIAGSGDVSTELRIDDAVAPPKTKPNRDDFWGAKLKGDILVGRNVLGKLLTELREKVRQSPTEELQVVQPASVPNFRLLGEEIETVEGRTEPELPRCAVSFASPCG